MRVPFLLSAALELALASAALAQGTTRWTAQLEVGADRYWGGSVSITDEHRSFRPYRPTVFGIGLERGGKSLGLGLQLRYLEASLGLEGPGAVAAVDGIFQVVSLAPELTYHVATLGPMAELRLHAGPLLEFWDLIDQDAKTRLGAQAAASLDIPLGGRFAGSVLFGLAVTPSPFEAEQLGSGFETSTLWRRRVAGALRYRL
jgi:hypothetical protein